MMAAFVCAGCVSTNYDDYYCNNKGPCDLPERRKENKALIYLIRPSSLFNNAEMHHIYVVHSGRHKEYIGSYSGAEYCVYHANPGRVQLVLTGGKKDSDIVINASKDLTYYVYQNLTATLTSTKLTTHLSVLNVQEGERRLRMATGKCQKLKSSKKMNKAGVGK